jgi:hypothetical protein
MAKFELWFGNRKAEGHTKFGADLFVMLNTLAPCYHSAFGYHLDEHYYDKGSFFSQVTVPYVKMSLVEEGTLCPFDRRWGPLGLCDQRAPLVGRHQFHHGRRVR